MWLIICFKGGQRFDCKLSQSQPSYKQVPKGKSKGSVGWFQSRRALLVQSRVKRLDAELLGPLVILQKEVDLLRKRKRHCVKHFVTVICVIAYTVISD